LPNPIPLLQDFDAAGVATIKGVRDPVAAGDVTPKSYVDQHVANLRTALSLSAIGPISGHRAIVSTGNGARYPSTSVSADGDLIVGISTNAADDGDEVIVRTNGEIVEPSWNWTPGPIFAGNNGVLTQTPPSGAWIRQVGVAVAPTKVVVDLRPTFLTP